MWKKIRNYFWCGITNIYNKKLVYDGFFKKQGEGIYFSCNKCNFFNILKIYNLKVYMQLEICMLNILLESLTLWNINVRSLSFYTMFISRNCDEYKMQLMSNGFNIFKMNYSIHVSMLIVKKCHKTHNLLKYKFDPLSCSMSFNIY